MKEKTITQMHFVLNIRSKYAVGQEVFFMMDDKVNSEFIREIYLPPSSSMTHTGMHVPKLMYVLEGGSHLQEGSLFRTKEDLLKSL